MASKVTLSISLCAFIAVYLSNIQSTLGKFKLLWYLFKVKWSKKKTSNYDLQLCSIFVWIGSPAPREKRDASDHGDACTALNDNCNAVSYCDVDLLIGTCKLTWWFILIIVFLVFLVIGLVLFAIWKKLGLSCTKIKLMMMVR